MDVERIQKVNSLALDLMRQGLAADREEATLQAERIFRSKDSEEFRSTYSKVHGSQQQAATTVISTDNVHEILEQNTKFLVKTIKEFQDKMAQLEKEVSDLRVKLSYERLPTVREIITQAVPSPASSATHMPSSAPAQAKPQGSHPRSGNFNENDVSIEKFFYMGSK